jgi:hypothetical protein
VRDFLAADLRRYRIGCEHEDERMGSLDCPVDRSLPCVSGRNPFPIAMYSSAEIILGCNE